MPFRFRLTVLHLGLEKKSDTLTGNGRDNRISHPLQQWLPFKL